MGFRTAGTSETCLIAIDVVIIGLRQLIWYLSGNPQLVGTCRGMSATHTLDAVRHGDADMPWHVPTILGICYDIHALDGEVGQEGGVEVDGFGDFADEDVLVGAVASRGVAGTHLERGDAVHQAHVGGGG